MSKRVNLTCKIINADKRIFERSLENMMKLMDGEIIKIKNSDEYKIRTEVLGPFSVTVALKNGQITVEGFTDYNSAKNAQELVEEFYTATEIEEEFNAPMKLDKEGDILIALEV